MPRSYVLTFGTLVLALATLGCGESDSFMPPPRPDLATPPPEAKVTVVELIMPAERTGDRQVLAQLLRVLAARARSSFRLSALDPSDPPQKQAELIRKAADRGATVLIVDPAPSDEVTKALESVRSQGVPCLLLGPLHAQPEKPFPVLSATPYEETAGKLVAAAVEDAKKHKAPADASAVVLTVREPTTDARSCQAAFETALKKANVPTAESLPFDGTLEGAKTALNERLAADPKLAIVLVGDDNGFTAALDVRYQFKGKRPIIVAGYVRENPLLNDTTYSQTAAIVMRAVAERARDALKLALDLVAKTEVPDHVVTADEFRRFESKYVDPPPPPTDPRLAPAPGQPQANPE